MNKCTYLVCVFLVSESDEPLEVFHAMVYLHPSEEKGNYCFLVLGWYVLDLDPVLVLLGRRLPFLGR